jgi:hypothetical protein
MARDRNRADDQMTGPERNRRSEMEDADQVRGGAGEDMRGVAGEEEEEFEETEDLEEEEDEGSY